MRLNYDLCFDCDLVDILRRRNPETELCLDARKIDYLQSRSQSPRSPRVTRALGTRLDSE